MTDITVKNVDVNLLRNQRDSVCDAILGLQQRKLALPQPEEVRFAEQEIDGLEGVLELLSTMLDLADGFPVEE